MWRCGALAGPWVLTIASTVAIGGGTTAATQLSIEDLARFGAVGDPNSLTWNERPGSPGLFSPDGERLAVVLRGGNTAKGTNDASLLVYSRAQLLSGGEPQKVGTFASATNFQPISLVRWLADGETLVFAATQGDEHTQVYSLNIRTSELRQLTSAFKPMLWFDLTPGGSHLAMLTQRPYTPLREQEDCRRHGCRVTNMRLGDTEWGLDPRPSPLAVYDLSQRTQRSVALSETLARDIKGCDDELAGGISPDGRFALRRCEIERWPNWWSDYTDRTLRRCLTVHGPNCAMIFVLMDFASGETTALNEAPAVPGWNQPVSVLWVDGGRRFILAGAFEPLEGIDSVERAQRAGALSALSIDPRNRSSQRIARLDGMEKVAAARWDGHKQILSITGEDASRKVLPVRSFQRKGQHWAQCKSGATAGSDADPQGRIRLSIEQTLNDRPILMVSDMRTGSKRRLLDPNPWLAERALGRVEAVSWPLSDGTEWRGGIYYPPDYSAGRRYPVVLQTHGFDPSVFSLTGVSREFAARALTAQGIVVLQVSEVMRGREQVSDSPRELERAQSGYEAAVAYLDRRGIADTTRIGIQGWSRTGPYMGYTLTHSSMPIAAGVFGDTADFGWHFYVMVGAPLNLDALYGASPFGPGINEWVKLAPTFNLDRVKAPMLMLSNGTGAGLWDWYVGLRRLEKPVEYWVYPDGVHETFQIPQLLRHNQLLVDWFRFWLKDEVDASPDKSEQYLRWSRMAEESLKPVKEAR